VAAVQVQSETETPTGWVFTVLVHAAAPPARAVAPTAAPPPPDPASPDAQSPGATRHEVSLSWVDYEHWSRGRVAPEHVVRAVIEALIDAQWLPLPPRFDASTARRWVAHLDDAVRTRL